MRVAMAYWMGRRSMAAAMMGSKVADTHTTACPAASWAAISASASARKRRSMTWS